MSSSKRSLFVLCQLFLFLSLSTQQLSLSTQSQQLEEDVSEETSQLRRGPGKAEENKTVFLVKKLANVTKDAGGSLKLRCEARGDPRVTHFKWYKNEVPIVTEKGRVRIESKYGANPQVTLLKISVLDTLDTGFYKCEASNERDTAESTAVVRVNLGSYGRLPVGFPPAETHFPGGINDLPTNIEFVGRQTYFQQGNPPPSPRT